ncbi:MAG: Eco57I restriction-modification methylase domain-containing protein, partial [Veillonella sp.]|nr:Eco57I restriction-modification methylase domain-containing protein [Veillonella sp.]
NNSGIVQLAYSGLDDTKPGKKDKKKGEKKDKKKTPKGKDTPGGKKPVDKSKEAFKVLGDIYTRLPMLVFGCDMLDKDITLQLILDEVDDASWSIFMPKGVGKAEMRILMDLGVLKEDIFASAASIIPAGINAADKLPITERVKAITKLIKGFRFPDKETVLTPWHVVNMHMSDTIGGYDFFDETHNENNELNEPRFVNHEGITNRVFRPEAKVLEINSKSGLYPLYMAYSLYRERIKHPITEMFAPSVDTEEGQLYVWDKVLSENLYVLCMSEMAAKITHRVLAGYRNVKTNARPYLKGADLIEDIKNKNEFPNVVARIKGKNNFWGNNMNNMNFDAIVGNPPYQVMDGGTDRGAMPVYQYFVETAKMLHPSFISMIMPSRWYAGGRGLDEFRAMMITDLHVEKLIDFENSKDVFPTVDIAGGICYFLINEKHDGPCTVVNKTSSASSQVDRYLNEFKVFIRSNKSVPILKKITKISTKFLNENVLSINPFGFRTYFRGSETEQEGDIKILTSQGWSYIPRNDVKKSVNLIDAFKVIVGRFVPNNGEINVPEGEGYRVITAPQILKPAEINTETYIDVAAFFSFEETEHYVKYLKTKFSRFLLRQSITSVNVTKECFAFVPVQDFKNNTPIDWTKSVSEIDEQLFAYYGLTESEQKFIKDTIKKMN